MCNLHVNQLGAIQGDDSVRFGFGDNSELFRSYSASFVLLTEM